MTKDIGTLMNPKQFWALAETYGGCIERWPDVWRDAALVFASTAEGSAILARATELDLLLDAYQVQSPSLALQEKILNSAAGNSLVARSVTFRWWLGLGLAGAGLAGALTGAVMAVLVLPGLTTVPAISTEQTATTFGDLGSDMDMTREVE